ncbi:MAG: 1-deoxy-D-xylulose-5-phosphate reductoisomerase [Deltaproteobacteria bacterium]|jgi:1-deoxy-D-xylulose-5-phosphate reductoisomerase|nr:1-deoxy-D-xylulose-5-phosphate reductoisomerase [Deltaproteobacteria bacterium]
MQYLWPAVDGAELSYISRPPSQDWAERTPRVICLLGSTGSIGASALKVVEAHPKLFQIHALAGARNVALLAEQAMRFRPPWIGVLDGAAADALRGYKLGYAPRIVAGPDGYAQLAGLPELSTVLSAQSGAAGLRATLEAARAGKVVCLANKESLVLAGEYIRSLCARTGAVILPVDSEHNAIFQALAGRSAGHVRRILLTASGGPFRDWQREALAAVTPEQALRHPNWSMGTKITIDSATLMNKGLEVIEACQLYGLPLERVEVILHPQSLVHSLVEFVDGSLMAQLGTPDMRMPIGHCLAWPRCLDLGVAPLDLLRSGSLTFEAPDEDNFPCLSLARRALRHGKGMPVALNAGNEVAVELFLAGRIAFLDIPALISDVLDSYESADAPGMPDSGDVNEISKIIEKIDTNARLMAAEWAK